MTISREALNRVIAFGHELDRDAELPDIEKIAGLYPRGFLSLFAAQAGTGKTWFMQYIACSLSVGGNILAGLVAKSRKMKTIIFAGETGKYLLDKRLQATIWPYDKKRIKVYDAVELQREEIPIMLNTSEGRATTIAILEHEKPDIIFYDTLISFHTADESKQGDMTSIYTFLLKLAREFNCAVVLNHHTRKRSNKMADIARPATQDDIIGCSAGVRLASCAFIATQEGIDDSSGMPTITVRDVKSWDKKLPPFSYQFVNDPETGKLDFAIDWGTTAENTARSLRERVSNLIASYDHDALLSTKDIALELATSQDSARNYLEELAKNGKVERTKIMNAVMWRVL